MSLQQEQQAQLQAGAADGLSAADISAVVDEAGAAAQRLKRSLDQLLHSFASPAAALLPSPALSLSSFPGQQPMSTQCTWLVLVLSMRVLAGAPKAVQVHSPACLLAYMLRQLPTLLIKRKVGARIVLQVGRYHRYPWLPCPRRSAF